MTCAPFCDMCGGNLDRAGQHFTCTKCLRSMPKKRIRAVDYDPDNYSHFALRGRSGRGWRYYRKVELAKEQDQGLLSPARDGAASAT